MEKLNEPRSKLRGLSFTYPLALPIGTKIVKVYFTKSLEFSNVRIIPDLNGITRNLKIILGDYGFIHIQLIP